MKTTPKNTAALAWQVMLDTHDELQPLVQQRASRVMKIYKVTQLTALFASGCLAIVADAFAQSSLLVATSHSWIGFGGACLLVLSAVGHIHCQMRQAKWGYSASSLQYIYKAQDSNYDTHGQLVCINCKTKIPAVQSRMPLVQKESAQSGCSCTECGFTLWPQSSRFGQLFLRVCKPI